jgi:hypothetical protein
MEKRKRSSSRAWEGASPYIDLIFSMSFYRTRTVLAYWVELKAAQNRNLIRLSSRLMKDETQVRIQEEQEKKTTRLPIVASTIHVAC